MGKRRKQKVKHKLIFYSIVLGLIFALGSFFVVNKSVPLTFSSDNDSGLWKYQCIDTMKTSRDRARNWHEADNLHNSIRKQVAIIKELGANCIAIDTPYDVEFRPYLISWVAESRRQNLHIWFRGNFSGWEGWFEYPHTLESDALLSRTAAFIEKNPSLFKDGDIFTPAPEGENGGEFNQVEIDEYPAFRKFLSNEYIVAKQSFAKINKKIEVNWLSMNGGLAKRMLDQKTVDAIGKTVTIDHYINSAAEMSSYVTYFNSTFRAKVIIGEFGAPVPDINNYMSEDKQADFIDSLFRELYLHRDKVEGVNYWVLYDSSTALLNPDGTKRKAADVVQKYFKPLRVNGKVADIYGDPLSGVNIQDNNFGIMTTSNEKGEFTFLIPRAKTTLSLKKALYGSKTLTVPLSSNEIKITLIKLYPNYWDRIRTYFK